MPYLKKITPQNPPEMLSSPQRQLDLVSNYKNHDKFKLFCPLIDEDYSNFHMPFTQPTLLKIFISKREGIKKAPE